MMDAYNNDYRLETDDSYYSKACDRVFDTQNGNIKLNQLDEYTIRKIIAALFCKRYNYVKLLYRTKKADDKEETSMTAVETATIKARLHESENSNFVQSGCSLCKY